MTTLVGADNFTHGQIGILANLPPAGTKRVWSAGAGTGWSWDASTHVRDGRGMLKCIQTSGTGSNMNKTIAAGNQHVVASVYIVCDTAPASVSNVISLFGGTEGKVRINSTGVFSAQVGAGTVQNSTIQADDGVEHRIDMYLDASTATATLKWAIDGTAQTDATLSAAAADITQLRLGSTVTTHVATFWLQDLVWSHTGADYPIGAHRVQNLLVDGDGTHNTGGAGAFDKADGTDITDATTDAWTELDPWGDGAAVNAADFITMLTTALSTEYTEHTFANTTETTILAVCGYVACWSSSATASFRTVRIVDSGGTTVADIVANEDVSETTPRYWFGLASQNVSDTTVNGYKVRSGLSTDVNPANRFGAVMLQLAVPGDPSAPPAGGTEVGWYGAGVW